MNADQVERLLEELSATRQAFELAAAQIKWNRINTIIQYALIGVVIIMIVLGVGYYLDDKHEACIRGNEFRASIQSSLDSNAAAIGTALAIVTDAPEESFREYIDAYNQQDKPAILQPRKC